VIHFSRTSHRYLSRAPEQAILRKRIRELAEVRVSYGYKRIHVLLLREGWKVNHKRVYRLYRMEGLAMRTKKPRRRHVSIRNRTDVPAAVAPNQVWSMDFMHDELFNGDWIRLLTLVDNFTRVSPWIEVDRSLTGKRVVEVLNRVAFERGLPKTIRVDHGTEFTSKALDQWAYANGVELDFTRPGKPTDNAFIESFNGRVRQECLNENWFLSLEDARQKVESWRQDYNNERPHSALGQLTPTRFALDIKAGVMAAG
jgi:putative transposase